MSGVASRDTRTEQAICFGRSNAWILAHIGGTQADIQRAIDRMDAAAAGDNAAYYSALLHPAEVHDGEAWHGSTGGYARHRRRGELTCPECSTAHSKDTANRRRRRRSAA